MRSYSNRVWAGAALPLVTRIRVENRCDLGGIMDEKLLLPLVARIRSEYREMPSLSLTVAQAQRLWGLDEQTCRSVLKSLECEGFLKRAADGSYRRAGGG